METSYDGLDSPLVAPRLAGEGGGAPPAASAAGDAHMPRHRGALVAAVDHEVVPLGLAGDRLVDGVVEQAVALRGAQHRAQVGGVFLAEAHEQRAGAGDAHAVAGFTEIVPQGRNKAEPSAGLRDPDITV